MGKYSQVSGSSLQNEANKALQSLNQHDLNQIKKDLQLDINIQCSAKEVAIKYLDKINSSNNLSGSISVLKTKLQKLSNAGGMIQDYQNLEKEIKDLEKHKYREEIRTDYYIGEDGETHENTYKEKVLDKSVVRKIERKEKELKDLEQKIDRQVS